MIHPNASSPTLQGGFYQLLRVPFLRKPEEKKIKKDDVVIQLKELLDFFRGSYLEV